MAYKDAICIEISAFYRQLAVMITSGVPIEEALATMGREKDLPRMRRIAVKVAGDMAKSTSLGDALAKYPKMFSPVVIKLLTSDIPTGRMAEILFELADTEERSGQILKKTLSMITYPAVVLFIAVLLTIGMCTLVIPKFQDMFYSMGMELPALTKLVLNASTFLKENLWYILTVSIVLIIGIFFNRKTLYAVSARMPVMGSLQKKNATACFSGYTALMLSMNVPFTEALELAAASLKDLHFRSIFRDISAKSANIKEFMHHVSGQGLFPEMLVKSLEFSETPEKVGKAMVETADFYNKYFATAYAKTAMIFEVVILYFLGVTIGAIVIAMYLPIFFLGSTIV